MRATGFNALIILLAIAAVFGVATYAARPTSAEGANAPPQFNTDITFGNNTMADFSATSGEPIIKSDTAGNTFVTPPFGLRTPVGLLWKSADGGRSFVPLGSPIVRDSVTAS